MQNPVNYSKTRIMLKLTGKILKNATENKPNDFKSTNYQVIFHEVRLNLKYREK